MDDLPIATADKNMPYSDILGGEHLVTVHTLDGQVVRVPINVYVKPDDPHYMRSANRFVDVDGNGKTDVVYHTGGMNSVKVPIEDQHSFLQSSDGTWTMMEDVGLLPG
ncbi:MAG: hypothetical protein AAFS10_09880, partial [Myxococcota bacterium]